MLTGVNSIQGVIMKCKMLAFGLILILLLCAAGAWLWVWLRIPADGILLDLREFNHEHNVAHKISTSQGEITVRVFEIDASSRSLFFAPISFTYGEINHGFQKLQIATPLVYKEYGYWRTHFYFIMTSDGRYGVSSRKPSDNKAGEDIVRILCRDMFPIDKESYDQLFTSQYRRPSVGLVLGEAGGIGILMDTSSSNGYYSAINFNPTREEYLPLSSLSFPIEDGLKPQETSSLKEKIETDNEL